MLLEVFIASVIAFVSTLIAGYFLRNLLIQSGLVAQDINKKGRPILPTSGGLVILVGLFAGVMVLIASMDYFVNSSINIEYLLLALVSVVSIAFIGFVDDLSGGGVRTSKEDLKKMTKNYTTFNGRIKQWQKPLLTLIAAAPLMVANFGTSVSIPFLGTININPILYIIVLVPLAVIFASNALNMLEGLNGLSVQMGFVVFAALAIYSFHIGSYTSLAFATIFAGALAAYVYYGGYPAKILPGDSLTYLIGGGIAATILIGRMQVLGIILLVPWIIEFFLKARARFHAHSWGVLQSDGRLKSPHGNKIYSLTHIFLRTGRFKEWQIVWIFTLIELFVAFIGLAIVW
ncbi:MAG: hypothetical protein M1441_01220 [Candidatus Parvarchaeota archaeon]|jgi:UDP-N-acetylglucosamine--dolichyl-phosphate N-acetylglucosaminephosphotransferase|nr:hypothetical protein [Candidatus Parvarchaeota archaeon]